MASYQRSLKALKEKLFAEETVAVEIKGRKGSVFVSEDEEPGRFQEDKLRALRPAFDAGGSVTAGNASSINDGAAAVVVISPQKAEEPRRAAAGQDPRLLDLLPRAGVVHLGPRTARSSACCKSSGIAVADVDLFEVNEAFSVVAIAAMKQLNIPHEKMNVHGGAVALGHPIGASGTRILVTLLSALKQREKKIGVASLCIGGGEAVAMAVERL